MPAANCFSYSAGSVLSGRNRGAAPPNLSSVRNMPHACFSYSAAAPLDIRNRNTTRPAPGEHPGSPGGHSGFVSSSCMSYPVFACFRY